MSDDTYPVGAAKTTFDVVRGLKELDGAGVTELANHLGMSKGGVHNHLQTLKRLGFVRVEEGTYHVGLGFLEVGSYAQRRLPVYHAAKPEVSNLAQMTGEVASLVVEEGGEGVALFTAETERSSETHLSEGTRVPLHSNAPGKAILAFRPGSEVDRILDERGLPAMTDNTLTDRDALFSELQTIRERGLAFDRAEQFDDRYSVAAPVTDADDRAVGAISVIGSTSNMSGKRLEEDVAGLVVSTKKAVEVALPA